MLSTSRPFRGPVHGSSSCIRGPVALPRYWIPPTRPGRLGYKGWLLIRHLSSSGTFRGSYDAPPWPPVGIVRVLRRNSVSAPLGSPFGSALGRDSTPLPFTPQTAPSLAYSRFAILVRESRARIPRDCYPDCASGSLAKTRPAFMGASVNERSAIHPLTLDVYDDYHPRIFKAVPRARTVEWIRRFEEYTSSFRGRERERERRKSDLNFLQKQIFWTLYRIVVDAVLFFIENITQSFDQYGA